MIETHTTCSRVSETKICPFCYSQKIIKNGHTKTHKQQYYCKTCLKRFLDYYTYNAYRSNINTQIIQFTKEGLGIRSTARVLKISITTVLKRIIAIAKGIPRPVLPFDKKYEMDEMRFFIRKKKNEMWLAYAIDKETKQVSNFYIGKRNNNTLKAVIRTLENSNAVKIFTDGLKNYPYLISNKIHVVKRYATNSIERKNLSIRIHLKRFSRKTICFSRNMIVTISVLRIYFWCKCM